MISILKKIGMILVFAINPTLLLAPITLESRVWRAIPIVLRIPIQTPLMSAIERMESGSIKQDGCMIGDYSEFGQYQIRLPTVREVYKWKRAEVSDDEIKTMLCNPRKAYWMAKKTIQYCRDRGRKTDYQIAYCWNGGPRARPGNINHEAHRYARQIASDLAVVRLKLMMEE